MPKTISQLSIADRKVFLRVDFNVSLDSQWSILDDTRIREALPTLEYALGQGAKLILASHLGRPQGKKDPRYSLLPVAERLSTLLNREVIFPEDCVGDAVRKLTSEMKAGNIILLENLRFHEEEEANDAGFAQKLSQLAEVYVTDAFGTLHRAHASTVGMVSHFQEKGIGFLVEKELRFLNQALENPQRPFLAILGGAKVADKVGVIEHLLTKVDALLIGGAMAYTFLKAQGKKIGNSRVEENKLYLAAKFLERAEIHEIPLLLPIDHQIAPNLDSRDRATIVEGEIPEGQMGLDIGPRSVELFRKRIREAKTIVWNGPMGVYETPPFDRGTLAIAQAVAESDAFSIIGGGDSAAAVVRSGVADQISHISTGGGATLEYLEGNSLAGLKALEE